MLSLYVLNASDNIVDYTVTCEGGGCTAAVTDGVLSVTCPRGKSCTVTVTDETGTLTDSVYIAHETAAIRLVRGLHSLADSMRETNLYTFAAYFYRNILQ